MPNARSLRRPKPVVLVVLFNLAMLCVIGAAFFVQDYRYSVPTPKPAGFHAVNLHRIVTLPGNDRRVTLLCFASPDCGCSRFNQDHLWDLAHRFGKQVRIVEVIEASNAGGMDSPDDTIFDPDAKLAKECGVYSTPQAVVLDRDRRIAYSGNFNSARFCSDPGTQFARLALEALVAGRPVPPMPESATTPYGCEIQSEVGTK